MADAFIVKDPKTYINAEEAWYKFSGKKEGSYLFIIIPKNDPNNTLPTFHEVIDEEKWKEVIWYNSYSNYFPSGLKKKREKSRLFKWFINGREYLYNYLDKLNLNKLAKKYHKINRVFSGHKNTQEHLAAALEPEVLYIMDSGIKIRKRIKANGYIDIQYGIRKNPIKFVMNKLVGLKMFDREKTKFFTAYKDAIETKHEIVENQYSYRKMLLNKKEQDDQVFFVSSPIYTFENIEIEAYVNFIKSVFQKLEIDSSNFVYLPHPTYETKSDIEFITNNLGCAVDDRSIPVESKITLYEKLPMMCISPLSSALINLAVVSEDKFCVVAAWHYQFDCFKVLKDWKNDSLENNASIKILHLNEKETNSLFQIDSNDNEDPVFQNFREYELSFKDRNKFQIEISS